MLYIYIYVYICANGAGGSSGVLRKSNEIDKMVLIKLY